jgi:glycosyltransferase involved in cell wall biosynthesis
MSASPSPMRIALVAPPMVPVPPVGYGGTERIVGVLANHLHARGHDVTLYASGDSRVTCRLVPVVPRALWPSGFEGNPAPFFERAAQMVAADAGRYDVIHSHLEGRGFDLARRSATPVISTLHGRIDTGVTALMLDHYPDIALVAISDSQRSYAPSANWLATIHNGLELESMPAGDGSGGYLLMLGRLAREKGVAQAIEVARRSGLPLVIAAKAISPGEREVHETQVAPAAVAGHVRFIGEVGGQARDQLFANALATLMLGDWPEPFGLVAIESLAAGTPVIARRAGALPEIVEHGTDGFVVDDLDQAVDLLGKVDELDRGAIRRRALVRFSAERMVDQYAELFERVASGAEPRAAVPAAGARSLFESEPV